jgi:hypothetical protein
MKFLIDFKHNNNTYKVYKSDHTNDKRGPSNFTRDQFIDEKRYKEIIKQSLKHGLTSFNDKGCTVVSFFDNYKTSYAVLLKIVNHNSIYIISVYRVRREKGSEYKSFFIKEHNRINLWNYYTMDRMNKEELKTKKNISNKEKINKECLKEDKIFKNVMKDVKKI